MGDARLNVIVTGGAGFIGSTVASRLAEAGHEFDILDDLSTGRRDATQGRGRLHVVDVSNSRLLIDLIDRELGSRPRLDLDAGLDRLHARHKSLAGRPVTIEMSRATCHPGRPGP